MRAIAADRVAWSTCLSVGVTTMSLQKVNEMEIAFGEGQACMGRRNMY